MINFLHLLFFLLLTVLFTSHWYACVSSDQSKLLFNDIASYFALSLEDHLFYNAIPELISASEHVTLCSSPKAVNPLPPPTPQPLLAVDLSIRRGESQGVIHDRLIDEDFNLIWFVNFNCPQSAFCAVFCNTRPWNGQKNRLLLNNGISQFSQN